ncbi:MAG: hypothetical protein IJ875_00840, partial [Solobacterium sp.]|nr:hypothetical protein [Solobacterium sp.]
KMEERRQQMQKTRFSGERRVYKRDVKKEDEVASGNEEVASSVTEETTAEPTATTEEVTE